jgi:hypothetical protein
MPDDNAPATKADLAATRIELLERIEKIETNLLRAFRNWAAGSETRMKVNTLLVNSFDERLTAVEDRLGHVEERLIK